MYKDIVFNIISHIPAGKVTTYAALARQSRVNNARVVGSILHTNQYPEKFPCHRVVRSDGTLASGYVFGGKTEQYKKLISEGVIFKKDKVDLNSCLWPLN